MVLPILRQTKALATLFLILGSSTAQTHKTTATQKQAAAAKASFLSSMRNAIKSSSRAEAKKNLYNNLLAKATPVTPHLRRENGYYFSYYEDDAANDDEYSDYGFDISAYSLKYAGCSSITTYSDNVAAADGSTTSLLTSQYIVFRFCPSDTCSDSSNYGCSYDYGEYMLPLGDWLEIISAYREEEFERYCDFCEGCLAMDYYAAGDDGRRLEDAAGDDAAGDDAAGDDAAGDDAAGDDAVEGDDVVEGDDIDAEPEHACAYYDACLDYENVCAEEKVDYSAFFECTQYDVDDENSIYIGPHCTNDKGSIILGIFKDEYCSTYDGSSSYDVGTLTGIDVENSMEDFYKTDCISCQESTLPYQQVDEDAEDNDSISEVCENLYSAAAKCNKHIGGASDKSYSSYQQADNEGVVCSFIKSVVTGSYDEYGYIYVNTGKYLKDNTENEYAQYATPQYEVTVLQVLGVLFFVFLCLGLMIWSCVLHRAIQRKKPWTGPQRDGSALLAGQLSRQNSGIVMCRSKSYQSYPGGTMA